MNDEVIGRVFVPTSETLELDAHAGIFRVTSVSPQAGLAYGYWITDGDGNFRHTAGHVQLDQLRNSDRWTMRGKRKRKHLEADLDGIVQEVIFLRGIKTRAEGLEQRLTNSHDSRARLSGEIATLKGQVACERRNVTAACDRSKQLEKTIAHFRYGSHDWRHGDEIPKGFVTVLCVDPAGEQLIREDNPSYSDYPVFRRRGQTVVEALLMGKGREDMAFRHCWNNKKRETITTNKGEVLKRWGGLQDPPTQDPVCESAEPWNGLREAFSGLKKGLVGATLQVPQGEGMKLLPEGMLETKTYRMQDGTERTILIRDGKSRGCSPKAEETEPEDEEAIKETDEKIVVRATFRTGLVFWGLFTLTTMIALGVAVFNGHPWLTR